MNFQSFIVGNDHAHDHFDFALCNRHCNFSGHDLPRRCQEKPRLGCHAHYGPWPVLHVAGPDHRYASGDYRVWPQDETCQALNRSDFKLRRHVLPLRGQAPQERHQQCEHDNQQQVIFVSKPQGSAAGSRKKMGCQTHHA